MDSYVKNPGLLSFLIASKIPASESTRQELLEIDEISYRLRRVIELLECCNIRCKMCQVQGESIEAFFFYHHQDLYLRS